MRKVYIILLLSIAIMTFGCENNNYKDFEHYTLDNKELKTHAFFDEKNKLEYAITDITEEKKDEGGIEGLFYKVAPNDYILLDEIEVCGAQSSKLYLSDQYTYFYKNEETNEKKLYINRCLGGKLIEYTLNGAEYTEKELKFDTHSISTNPLEYVEFNSIIKVVEDTIYYKGAIHNTDKRNLDIKCSLKTLKCVLNS